MEGRGSETWGDLMFGAELDGRRALILVGSSKLCRVWSAVWNLLDPRLSVYMPQSSPFTQTGGHLSISQSGSQVQASGLHVASSPVPFPCTFPWPSQFLFLHVCRLIYWAFWGPEVWHV